MEGVGEVKWTSGSGRGKKTRSAKHRFYNSETYLFGSKSAENEQIAFGVYNYDFSCLIPANVPYTIERKHGHIRFKVLASLDIPWASDLESESTFKVERHEDLNLFPRLKNPMEIEELAAFCRFSCNSKPLIITVKLPHQGYAFGEEIPIHVSLDNKSTVKVYSTTLKLERVFQYIAEPFSKEECEDIDLQPCSGVEAGQQAIINKRFVIPTNVYASNDKFCKVLKVIYRFELTVFSDTCMKPKFYFPITVRKVGFRNVQNFPPSAPLEDAVAIETFTAIPAIPASAPAAIHEDLDLRKRVNKRKSFFMITNFISAPSYKDLVSEGQILL